MHTQAEALETVSPAVFSNTYDFWHLASLLCGTKTPKRQKDSITKYKGIIELYPKNSIRL